MTDRLYYTDSYLREFEATVVAQADDGRRIYLDRTAFYPTSGGQPFDTGQIEGVEVVDVIDEGDRIAHVLSEPLPDIRVAAGRVDWVRRFDHMQQHTGQHLLSAVFVELFGYSTLAVHFGRQSSTLDLDTGSVTQEQLDGAEDRANQIVVESRPVDTSFGEAGSVADLRKSPDRPGTLRIITIRDLDRSACGGTHVRATGEIGVISLGKIERVRKATRLEFCCGSRAIHRARADRRLVAQLAAHFSSAPVELPQLVQAQAQTLKRVQAEAREIQSRLDLCRAGELYREAAPDAGGIRRAVVRDSGESLEKLRGLAQAFASFPMAILIGIVDSPPAIVMAASPDTRVDAGGVLRNLLSAVGGKGGGSPVLAQGTLPGQAHLDSVVGSLIGKKNAPLG